MKDMRIPLESLMAQSIGTEIVYSFIVIVCSLMIYFATREIYELSSHKGLKYFRRAFLFFAVAYFFRSFIKFFALFLGLKGVLDISSPFFADVTWVIFLYASSMAGFYLIQSLLWNKDKSMEFDLLFHFIALILSFGIVGFRRVEVTLGLQVFLFLFLAVSLYVAYRKSRHKKNNLYFAYVLLFVFWILNILEIILPDFFNLYQLLIYLASTGIFMAILYKVLRKAG